jgi:hypothetical protein
MAESLSLDDLQKSGLKLPSFLKAKPKTAGGAEKIGLFLKVVDTTFEVGLLAGFDMQYNDTSFDFTGTFASGQIEKKGPTEFFGGVENDFFSSAIPTPFLALTPITSTPSRADNFLIS